MEISYVEENAFMTLEDFKKIVERMRRCDILFKPLEPFEREIEDYSFHGTIYAYNAVRNVSKGSIDGIPSQAKF